MKHSKTNRSWFPSWLLRAAFTFSSLSMKNPCSAFNWRTIAYSISVRRNSYSTQGFCVVLLLFLQLVQIWFGFCSFVSKCKSKCFSTLGILHLLDQLRINRNKDLAVYFHTPKWALSLVHQENNTIITVTFLPPCPCPLLILIKKIQFQELLWHTQNSSKVLPMEQAAPWQVLEHRALGKEARAG